ncbi:MAG: 23S rRNA (pseudouridine(1915)-N(3))-methyltransferase RlmH [bacterium]|nr:23S rRNA (pseudouridine(1915)-N(3))-methyltransferase RlmH [bacterium]
MKISILVVGKEKDFSAYEVVQDYSNRIEHHVPIEWIYIPTSTKDEEEKKILKTLDSHVSGSYIIALDELGKEFSSVKFSEFIQARMNSGIRSLVFIIGGSYGLTNEIRSRAQTTMALSMLTFPHQLVRLILAEQLYRAFTILKGEKYHH